MEMQVKGCQGSQQMEEAREFSYIEALEGGMTLLTPCFQTSSPQNGQRINFCCLKSFQFIVICYSSPMKLIEM